MSEIKEMKIYNKEEVFKSCMEYFQGDELASKVWIDKYCLKDSYDNLYEKNPNDMHKRIAKELARIENNYINGLTEEEIFENIKDFKYIVPQGSPMAGIGNDFQVSSLSNCFVIGPQKDKNGDYEDSYGSILRIDQEIIQLSKRRAGVGSPMEHIRINGMGVNNAALTSTGVIPFMERYSNTIREVAQSGRRGALLLATHIKHPDAEAFINAKVDTSKINGANISVKIDDEFMDCLEKNVNYTQQFPINSKTPKVKNEINPVIIWNKLIYNNWRSAEPGLLFWDTILRESIADCYSDLGYETIATNPCGEITLCDSDSCRLLLLNLFSYVVNPFTKDAYFNFDLFKEKVRIAQRFMDDIVDLELEKIDVILEKIKTDPETEATKAIELNLWLRIREKCANGRRTGTGVTGTGDMLAALGYKYGSKEGTEFSINIHKILAIECFKSSTELAKERGTFPIFDNKREENNPFLNRLYEIDPELKELTEKYGRRNIALLTISPAGSVSILTKTTSGIEPLFLPWYKRRRKINPDNKNIKPDFIDSIGDAWEEYIIFHDKFKLWGKINGYDNIETLKEEELKTIFSLSPYYKACSDDVDWKENVIMQGSIQKFVDHSISKTINLPNNATVELVDNLYRMAYKSGCKGITCYRNGSRDGVLLSTEKKIEEKNNITDETHAKKRPKKLKANIVRFNNKNEKWVAIVGILDDKPYEIFTGLLEKFNIPSNIDEGFVVKVKEGDNKHYDFEYVDKETKKTIIVPSINFIFRKEYWNYAKLISSMLRHRMPLVSAISVIENLTFDEEHINIWKNGVIRALKKFIKNGAEGGKCPKCGEKLIYTGGCVICQGCGDSKCG